MSSGNVFRSQVSPHTSVTDTLVLLPTWSYLIAGVICTSPVLSVSSPQEYLYELITPVGWPRRAI